MNAVMDMDNRIQVPVLLENVNGVEINCARYHAFLLQYIVGIQSCRREQFTSYHAVDMWSQLQPSIEAMASMGISHNDLNGHDVE